MQLHSKEDRTYVFFCRHCQKTGTTSQELMLCYRRLGPDDASPVPMPKGWDWVLVYGDNPIVLCEECLNKFRDRLIALRNEIEFPKEQ